MKQAVVLGLMLDLVVANLKDVTDEHDKFVRRAMRAAKRKIAECSKVERVRLEKEAEEARKRQPFTLEARARLVA